MTTIVNLSYDSPIFLLLIMASLNFLGTIKNCFSQISHLCNPAKLERNVTPQALITRNLIYFTHSQGKFRSNKAVLSRFYRLNWGCWIRPRAGRHKHLWKKPFNIHWWAKQHVFCTDEQNKVLDQMVSARYKAPTYFVDDPYEPYQKRNNLLYVPFGRNSTSTSYVNLMNKKM